MFAYWFLSIASCNFAGEAGYFSLVALISSEEKPCLKATNCEMVVVPDLEHMGTPFPENFAFSVIDKDILFYFITI